MFYRINIEDGYIHGVVKGVNAENANCTEEEYNHIKGMLENTPNAPDGFYYRLKDTFERELCEMPTISETATTNEQ